MGLQMARLTPIRANNGRTYKNRDFLANLLSRIDSRESKVFALANRGPTKDPKDRNSINAVFLRNLHRESI